MSEFCDTIRRILADDLAAIGAEWVRDDRVGNEEVCFYRAGNRLIAISFSPRDDATCRISPQGAIDTGNYAEWPSLWTSLGLDSNTDTDEGLEAYWGLFPENFEEYIDFIGKCLRKYF